MACIACGLGVNADGKGRVDVDTVGGLECNGTSGGLTNVPGNGLRIKKNATTDNSALIDENGLYVPRRFDFDTTYGVYVSTAAVANPNFPSGGTFASPAATITLGNSGIKNKTFVVAPSILWGTNDVSVGIWMELESNADGTWFTQSAISLTPGNIFSPVVGPNFFVTVAPGATKTIQTRMRLYTGNLASYIIQLSAWGGYYE